MEEDQTNLGGDLARERDELYQLFVGGIKDYGIFMLDPNGLIITWNAGAQVIKGWSEAEILNQHFSIFYSEEDKNSGKPQQHLEMAAANGRFESTGWRQRKDGSRFWANVVLTPIYEKSGVLRGFAKVTRDLTERKLTEQRLNEFYVVLAHELRTPLVSMRGSLDLIRTGALPPEQAQELLDISQTEAQRMLRLIDDLLDLKKIEEGQLKLNLVTVDPQSLVLRAINGLSGMTMECHVQMSSETLSTKLLRCDEDRILQVMSNLLSNAIKFSPPGSPVSVKVEDCRLGVRFSITDKGPGIPHKELRKLFQKFQQISTSDNRYSGSGLGLAISKSIVEQHGGKIGVDSEVGAGSTIWFELRTL